MVTKPKAKNGDEGQTHSCQPQTKNIGEAHDCQPQTQKMEMKSKLFVDNRKAKNADEGQTQVANPKARKWSPRPNQLLPAPKPRNEDQAQTPCYQSQRQNKHNRNNKSEIMYVNSFNTTHHHTNR
jgi:hypothetical protein